MTRYKLTEANAKARYGDRAKRVEGSRTTSAARAHVRLAQAVLTGELKHCAWELKLLYFGAKTDQRCERELTAWAKADGVGHTVEPVKIQAGEVTINTKKTIFRMRPA